MTYFYYYWIVYLHLFKTLGIFIRVFMYFIVFVSRSSMPANRSPQRHSTRESLTAWWESPKSRALSPSGGATWPMWSVTSQPKPSTSPSKTSTRGSSSAVWIKKHNSGVTSLVISHLVVLLVRLRSASSILWTSPEQDLLPTSARAQQKESSPVLETASPRSSRPMASRVFTLDSTCQCRVLSFTERPTSGASTQLKVRTSGLSDPFERVR